VSRFDPVVLSAHGFDLPQGGFNLQLRANGVKMSERTFSNRELMQERDPVEAWLRPEVNRIIDFATYLHYIDYEPD
jgi:hypothetical protein